MKVNVRRGGSDKSGRVRGGGGGGGGWGGLMGEAGLPATRAVQKDLYFSFLRVMSVCLPRLEVIPQIPG